jgi:hypothetical protein
MLNQNVRASVEKKILILLNVGLVIFAMPSVVISISGCKIVAG